MIDNFKQMIRTNNIKNFFKTYSGTVFTIVCFVIYALIFNFEEALYIPTGLFFAGVGFFFTETLLKHARKPIGYIFFIIVAISFAFLLEKNPSTRLEMVYAGMTLIMFFVPLYKIVNDKKDLADYVTRACTNIFKVDILTSINLVATGILFLLIDYLLIPLPGDLYLKIVYIILGLYTVPFTLMCLVDTKEPTMGFVDSVISKLLIPIMNIVFAIMIAYIIRIVFTLELPKNEIFAYVAELFIIMVPLSIVSKKYVGKYYEYNNKYLAYLFLAPLVLQIYSLGLRINQYGLTLSRYLGIFFIIFELITIYLMIHRNQKYIPRVLLVISAFSFVLLVLPFTNVYDSIILYHTNVIKSILSNREISDLSLKERRRVYYSYEYLYDFDEESLKNVEHLVNKDNIKEICNDECLEDENRYVDDSLHLIYNGDNSEIDVSNFNSIKKVESYIYDSGKINKYITVEKQKVDISDYLAFIIENKSSYEIDKEFSDYVKEHNIIEINENLSLYIEYLNIRYKKSTGEFGFVNIEGYFLYKQTN